jgi:hypothetical protein
VSELGWTVQAGPEPHAPSVNTMRYMIFQDSSWDWHSFNFDSHLDLLDTAKTPLRRTNADMSGFAAAGGKLLMFHGLGRSEYPANVYSGLLKRGLEGDGRTIENFQLVVVIHGSGNGTLRRH